MVEIEFKEGEEGSFGGFGGHAAGGHGALEAKVVLGHYSTVEGDGRAIQQAFKSSFVHLKTIDF